MTAPRILNPYKPGFGVRPPYFAGRQHETSVIWAALDAIQGRAGPMDKSPDPAIVLIGPRGVGKTVLLGRAMREANSRGIQAAKISPTLLSGPQTKLVSTILPSGFLNKIFEKVENLKLEFMQAGLAVGLKEAQSDIRSAIPTLLSRKPLLLALDEAHRCKPKQLNLLFGIIQDCMSADLPLAVVLAGTPGLESLLRKCESTYVERSEILRFNTLSSAAAKAALELPAKEHGRPMRPVAIKLLLDWSDNYPYFIQKAGRHAWNASVASNSKDISVTHANQGLAMADKERDRFLMNRRDELKDRHLVEHAAQVVSILRNNNGDTDEDDVERCLMEKNKDMGHVQATRVIRELQDVGYLWHSGDGLEPGIPSLFDFIMRKHERSTRRQGLK